MLNREPVACARDTAGLRTWCTICDHWCGERWTGDRSAGPSVFCRGTVFVRIRRCRVHENVSLVVLEKGEEIELLWYGVKHV